MIDIHIVVLYNPSTSLAVETNGAVCRVNMPVPRMMRQEAALVSTRGRYNIFIAMAAHASASARA